MTTPKLMVWLFLGGSAPALASELTDSPAIQQGQCTFCHGAPGSQAPSLDAAAARLKPEWVASWLPDPHDLRPRMGEGMPQLGLTKNDYQAVVQAFRERNASVPKTPRPQKKNVETGRARLLTLGCVACHSFGSAVPAAPGTATAPDLGFTKDRMDGDHVVAWILDPASLSPGASMPSFQVSLEDAIAVRDFLFLADPVWQKPAAVSAGPEPAASPVTWDQVSERVFGKFCVRCHSSPEGRFGYAPSGVDLTTREGAAAAADRLGPALLRRRHEAVRDTVQPGEHPESLTRSEIPGMPLGLPPLPDEDISLVLGWIDQGTPP